jgi:ribosomal protein S27E
MKTSFTYTESDKIVFCRRCGAIAGEPTKCPGYKSHDFATTTAPLICERCGASLGHPTKCPGWKYHSFRRFE